MRIVLVFCFFTLVYSCSNTTSPESTEEDITQHPDYQKGFDLVTSSKCSTCHLLEGRLTGPSFREIANKYGPATERTVADLSMKIIKGGMGNWGEIYMTPHPQVTEEDAKAMVRYVLLLKNTQ